MRHSYKLDKLNKIIYTCITGSYDKLKEPKYITPGWRYIAFTDNFELTSKFWEINFIDNPHNLDRIRLARRAKIMFWEYLPEHDLSIWIDGNVDVVDNIDKFCNKILNDKSHIWIANHHQANCIYEECRRNRQLKKDDIKTINTQSRKYKSENYPEDNGLVATNVIVRTPTSSVKELMTMWFDELLSHSYRDQLSFNYVLWKMNLPESFLGMFSVVTRDEYLKWLAGHK